MSNIDLHQSRADSSAVDSLSEFIWPDWPAPGHIRACSTVRFPAATEGVGSTGVFSGLNLADHVGDHPESVARNRDCLQRMLCLPMAPHWLRQVHGHRVINVAMAPVGSEADAAFAVGRGVCVVMTADCLPVLLCDKRGRYIAAAHAGWRGLASGILENTVAALGRYPGDVLAWLGPAIGPMAFQVQADVVNAFIALQPAAKACFQRIDSARWTADLYELARLRLTAAGVRDIYGGEGCTLSEPERFYSYRRDGQTGRMASLIWFLDEAHR